MSVAILMSRHAAGLVITLLGTAFGGGLFCGHKACGLLIYSTAPAQADANEVPQFSVHFKFMTAVTKGRKDREAESHRNSRRGPRSYIVSADKSAVHLQQDC